MSYKGFTNLACQFFPCHKDIKRNFNCLFCYCPLYAYECPGAYRSFINSAQQICKDCSNCKLPHNGYHSAWSLMQKWLQNPQIWMQQTTQVK